MRTGNCSEIKTNSVRIDWLRFSMPRRFIAQLEQRCTALFSADAQSASGRWHLDSRLTWHDNTCSLMYDDFGTEPKDYCILDLAGSAVEHIGQDNALELMKFCLVNGGHMTRLDLAYDFIGTHGTLVDLVRDACEAGELCGARVWGYHYEQDSNGRCENHGVTIGRRGSLGSGRFVRCYDKGIERTRAGAGKWESGSWIRFEAELSDEVATQYATAWIDGDDAARALMILDVVEFRQVNGRKRYQRPMAQWWDTLRQSSADPTRYVRLRVPTRAPGYARWLREQVMPGLLHLSHALNRPLQSIIFQITGEIDQAGRSIQTRNTAILELHEELKSYSGDAHPLEWMRNQGIRIQSHPGVHVRTNAIHC